MLIQLAPNVFRMTRRNISTNSLQPIETYFELVAAGATSETVLYVHLLASYNERRESNRRTQSLFLYSKSYNVKHVEDCRNIIQ